MANLRFFSVAITNYWCNSTRAILVALRTVSIALVMFLLDDERMVQRLLLPSPPSLVFLLLYNCVLCLSNSALQLPPRLLFLPWGWLYYRCCCCWHGNLPDECILWGNHYCYSTVLCCSVLVLRRISNGKSSRIYSQTETEELLLCLTLVSLFISVKRVCGI